MRNTLGDLNNHLFAQLERLNDEDIKGDELKEEIQRAKSVAIIASQIVSNANVMLQVQKMKSTCTVVDELPKILEG